MKSVRNIKSLKRWNVESEIRCNDLANHAASKVAAPITLIILVPL
jgi:hypothetical protein